MQLIADIPVIGQIGFSSQCPPSRAIRSLHPRSGMSFFPNKSMETPTTTYALLYETKAEFMCSLWKAEGPSNLRADSHFDSRRKVDVKNLFMEMKVSI